MYAMYDFLAKLTVSVLLLTFLTGICCSSCQKRTSLSDYYFPIEEWTSEHLYTYESLSEPKMVDEVWQYGVHNTGDQLYFKGQALDHNQVVTQIVMEQRTDLGMVTDSMVMYWEDSNSVAQRIDVKVINRATFPFYENSKDTLLFKVKWTDPSNGLEYTLDRQRVLHGDTTLHIMGKDIRAKVFLLFEELETFFVDDGATQSSWSGLEIYGEQIGLVYYKKEISPTLIREYRLKSIRSVQ